MRRDEVKKVSIFDFDGTLIDTALPEIGKKIWKEKTGEDYPHKGWWSKKETLDIDVFENKPFDAVEKAFKVERSKPNTFVVLCTGRIVRLTTPVNKILDKYGFEFDIVKTMKELSEGYSEFDLAQLEAFILERVKQYYKVNPSIVEAVLASGERELLAIGKKIEALDNIANSSSFKEASSTFKRVSNITKDIDLSKDMNIDVTLLEEEAEKTLYNEYTKVTSNTYDSYEQELDALLGLKPTLDKFFEDVMVNAEDENVKNNRKSLVASVYKSILNIADIKEVSI